MKQKRADQPQPDNLAALTPEQRDEFFMRQALALAEQAAAADEVPVGALVVVGDQVLGRGWNQREGGRDATLHAEMIAIREACATLGGWRLPQATLYVTLEPCPMCAGAMINARIERLVYGAADDKSGACGSVLDICASPLLNHRVTVTGGVLAAEAAALLRQFFSRKR
jgi:tRNA(adenine34) deaminase